MKNLVFRSGYNVPTIFQNRSLVGREHGTLQTCYQLQSMFRLFPIL